MTRAPDGRFTSATTAARRTRTRKREICAYFARSGLPVVALHAASMWGLRSPPILLPEVAPGVYASTDDPAMLAALGGAS